MTTQLNETKKEITINFKNMLTELESKNLNLCFLKNRGLFIEDNQRNLYQMEVYRRGSYLNKLIKDGIVVKFHQVDDFKSKNVGEWEKEVWGVSEVKDFMKRQSL